jgi:hypothetical protein
VATGSPSEPEPAPNIRNQPASGARPGAGLNGPKADPDAGPEPTPTEPSNPTVTTPVLPVPFSAPEYIFADLMAEPSPSTALPPAAPYLFALTQLYVYWLRVDGVIERSLKTTLGIERVGALPVPPDGELLLDDGPFWEAMAVIGDRSAVVTELSFIHFAPFDGTAPSVLPILSGVDSSGFQLVLSGLDSSENEALLAGPSCDQIFRVDSEGTVAPLLERESTANLRSTLRGTAERFWCSGPTLSRYEGTPPDLVLDIDVTARDFCEMGDAVVGIVNQAPSWIFQTDARSGGDLVKLPDTEGADRLACASEELTYWAKTDDERNLRLMALDAAGTSTEFHQLPVEQMRAWAADPHALYWLEDGKLVRWPRSALPE